MANTLGNLVGPVYAAFNQVKDEMHGMIGAVRVNANGAERVKKNQVVRYPIAPTQVASDFTPAMTPPTPDDQTIGEDTITIEYQRKCPIAWNGEEIEGLNVFGNGQAEQVIADQLAESLQTLLGEIETDLCELASKASGAYGVSSAALFSTAGDLSDSSGARFALNVRGAPRINRQLVLGNVAAAEFLANFWKNNEMGQAGLLSDGVISRIQGFDVRETNFATEHTAGTASSATTDTAGYAIGATTITLASAGTGTILAGDVISFAGSPHKYVVATGDADVSGGGTVVLNSPGLIEAIPASATAITVQGNHSDNYAFHRNAVDLVIRPTYFGDLDQAERDGSVMMLPNDYGLPFQVRRYHGYGMGSYELHISYGVKVTNPRYFVKLIGS